MPSPILILGFLVALIGAYFYGRTDGETINESKWQASILAEKDAREAALLAAAKEIAKIDVKHQTINRKVEREVRTQTVYAECRHSQGTFDALNRSLKNEDTDRP